jgi:hypothetical protein
LLTHWEAQPYSGERGSAADRHRISTEEENCAEAAIQAYTNGRSKTNSAESRRGLASK